MYVLISEWAGFPAAPSTRKEIDHNADRSVLEARKRLEGDKPENMSTLFTIEKVSDDTIICDSPYPHDWHVWSYAGGTDQFDCPGW